jgi:hypothetical protein
MIILFGGIVVSEEMLLITPTSEASDLEGEAMFTGVYEIER